MSRKAERAAPSKRRRPAAPKKPATAPRSQPPPVAARSQGAHTSPPVAAEKPAPAAQGRRLALLVCNGSFPGVHGLPLPGP
ncbi:MAG TPA: hypothetical protein VNZ44_15995, partial [Pyrinomonadaceae bacterium]|nr:hypothetical protein [Pyrinomonadaceae bacterium]